MQVGIIMYLPTSDARQRKEITEEFFSYRSLARSLWDDYSAYEHWAKIEVLTSFKINYSDTVCVLPISLGFKSENSISLLTCTVARISDWVILVSWLVIILFPLFIGSKRQGRTCRTPGPAEEAFPCRCI
jgi:hypothetical protein